MANRAQRTDDSTGYVVTMHRIIGTKTRVFAAYTPSNYFGRHSSLFSIDGQVHGCVGTKRISDEIAAIPVGPERFRRCDEHRAERYRAAYEAILRCFPEASTGHRSMGEIRVN